MGIYNVLYTIECWEEDAETVRTKTEIYSELTDEPTYFGWRAEDGPAENIRYLNNTVCSGVEIPKLPDSPFYENLKMDEFNRFMISASFRYDRPVMLAIALPRRFIIQSLERKMKDHVEPEFLIKDDRIYLMFPHDRGFRCNMNIEKLDPADTYDGYDVQKMVELLEPAHIEDKLSFKLGFAGWERKVINKQTNS